MEEKKLNFDRKKHVCYSNAAKKVMQEHLSMHYEKEKADIIWENIQRKYVEYLEDLPYLGGKKNTHNGTAGTYDCIALFAYYECNEIKPTLDEIYEMNNKLLLPAFQLLGKVINCNCPISKRLMYFAFESTAKKDSVHAKEWVGDYVMEVKPFDKEKGIYYEFTRCPIAEFAKAHGYLKIMPAICNGDYPAMEALHAGLIRKHTCANSDVCDYWIVGDKSKYLKEHPRKTDEQGFWYND